MVEATIHIRQSTLDILEEMRSQMQDYDDVINSLKEKAEKLEAVNEWFSGRFLSVWNMIPPEGLIVHKRGIEELRKILEAEG